MAARTAPDSGFAASSFEQALVSPLATRWFGWRLRLLVVAALAGCLALFTLMRWLAGSAYIDAAFQAGPHGEPVLVATPLPALKAHVGSALVAFVAADGSRTPVDALLISRSPRWQVDDAARARQVGEQQRLARALALGPVELQFADGASVGVAAQPRGWSGLGALFWPLAAVALLLVLVGAIELLLRPQARNLLFLTMALALAGHLVFIAIDSLRGLGQPAGAVGHEFLLRLGLDLAAGAALAHTFALHPRRIDGAGAIAAIAWSLAALVFGMAWFDVLPQLWWWAQGAMLALCALAIAVMGASYRAEPNPMAVVMRRLAAVAFATLALVTVAMGVAARAPEAPEQIGVIGSVIWYLFLASLLLLVPFLSRSKQLLREFALLAGFSTVAASLDLLLVAVFATTQFTSLAVAFFLALGVYAGARQWIMNHLVGSAVLTTERTFEHLYRAAREVRDHPERYAPQIELLLQELFDPLEVVRVDRAAPGARVLGNGAAVVVPVRAGGGGRPPLALVLRFARRGKRLFTTDDARLAMRVVEQMRRAVDYDRAVEKGRNLERERIAQDLHDDIGARLLTLMYQAPTPEQQDYIRRTLQDLKTLTRGLSAAEHRLSHACAEWKSDLGQRLAVAQVHLVWRADYDRDLRMSVVQWSAVTRVLRELVTNALYHGHASQVEAGLALAAGELRIVVADDGVGRNPQGWSHGLGMGGVRKRVKLLGGEVHWRERQPMGIVCEVRVPEFGAGQ